VIDGAFSNAVDWTPFVGDAKGVIEAIVGYQLGTGTPLTGFGRWAGLAGLAGFGELRYLKYADDAVIATGGMKAGGRYADDVTDVFRNCFRNSFSNDTPVHTDKGLIAIGALTAGSMALAYNETTGENEY
jgi:hypothetical protein